MVGHTSARALAILLLTIALLAGVAGCGGAESESAAPEPPAAEQPGAPDDGSDEAPAETADGGPAADVALTLVETKCSGCHTLDQVWGATYDRAGWERTVDRMQANGLRISEDERATIIDYLVGE